MGFRENVKADLRLRNLTIYAQWLSTITAISLYLIGVPLLVVYLLQGSRNNTVTWYFFESLLHALLFPLAPLALELPHHIRRAPFLYLGIASWIEFTGHTFIANFVYFSISDRPEYLFREFVKMVLLMMTTFVASSSIFLAHVTRSPSDFKVRIAVNVLCCVHLAVGWSQVPGYNLAQYVQRFYLVQAGMFAIAASLCAAAWVKQHQWVYSVTLGGTAIEPMILTIPVGGPRNQSIGDEAREGAIRLV
ncbi:hypothetical protein M3J09_008135 [Ascochyta lentis]